jgi:hypothetical protein
MANQVSSGGLYISKSGGNIRRWEPFDYALVAGEIGWDAYPTLANLQSVSQQALIPRTLLAIYNDLVALTGTQKTNIWTDLTSGSPVKISLDNGGNADSIFLLWRIASNASLPAATITDMKVTATAYYVQDVPNYLVHPGFDSTINVPGNQLS